MADMADVIVPDLVTRDIVAIFENVRFRLFERLENLTNAEFRWEPVSDCSSIRPGDDSVFRVATLLLESSGDKGLRPLVTQTKTRMPGEA